MKIFMFFNFVLIFVNLELIMSGKCGSDQLKLKPKALNLTKKIKPNLKKIKADSYTPISIGFDFTSLERPRTMSSSTFSKVKSLLKETREEFSKFLKINHESVSLEGALETLLNACELDKIGQDYENFLVDNDLIIFPMFSEELGYGVLAAATYCITLTKNSRPVAGVLYINSSLNFDSTNTDLYMKNLLLHEISHILAFSPSLFSKFNMNKTIGSTSYIVSENVLAKAKEHFGCDSLVGVPMENQGGKGSAGSHWESRYMLGDYMISIDYPDMAISDITLALFEDTGLYKVNYYSGGLFKFGKNKGCDFMEKKCMENQKATFKEEFCEVPSEPRCGSSKTIKSSCYIVDYYSNLPRSYQYFSDPKKGGFQAANYCPVPFEFDPSNYYYNKHCQVGIVDPSYAYGEIIGEKSFCFMSSLSNSPGNDQNSSIPVCYEVECDTSNSILNVKIGSETITCPTEGGMLYPNSGVYGSIDCPKYSDICTSSDGFVCNEMFKCLSDLAEKDNYNSQVTYYDYDGPSISGYGNDDDDEDGNIYPVRTTKSFNIKFNLSFLLFRLLIFIEF